MTARLLVIDNYDSFTYNLIQMFRRYALKISVFRADKISVKEVVKTQPDYILISPGPKEPASAGISIDLIRTCHAHIPILGVCLGMQCINEAFGGRTVHAPTPMHGKTSTVTHRNRGVFTGIPESFNVARYHSLAVDNVPEDLEITAVSDDNSIMGIAHRTSDTHGVQFHPESFLTEHGFTIIENFLKTGALRSIFS